MNENDHAGLCPVIWNFYYEYDENEWFKVSGFYWWARNELRLMPATSGVNPKKTEHNFQKIYVSIQSLSVVKFPCVWSGLILQWSFIYDTFNIRWKPTIVCKIATSVTSRIFFKHPTKISSNLFSWNWIISQFDLIPPFNTWQN